MKRPGVSVIEVLIAISMAAIVIAAVGNLIGSTHRLTTASGKEIQATAFARQWLDIVASQANQSFGCSCATNPCPGPTPTCDFAGPPAQTCTPRSSQGFNSCWLPNPLIGACSAPSMFKWNASTSTLDCGNPTTAITDIDFHPDYVAGTGFSFTRVMSITNIGNADTKQITVSVCWGSNDCTNPANNLNRTQITTLLTAWKKF